MASKSARRTPAVDEDEGGWSGLKIGLAVGIPAGVILLVVVIIIVANSGQTPSPAPPPVAGPVKPSVSPTPAGNRNHDPSEKPSKEVNEPSKEAKEKHEALFAEAQEAVAQMKYTKAIRLCSAGIANMRFMQDKSSRWYKLRAPCYLATKEDAQAAEDISRIIEIDGATHQLHFERAMAHGQARQFKEALDDLDTALALGGDKKFLTQVLLDFGDLQMKKYEDPRLALSAFTVAIKHSPTDEKLWLIRARHRLADPNVTAFAAAQADFRMAVKLNPKVKDTEKALAARLKIEDDD
jgi:tetratricopeptide (TPR) repeat protein